MQSLLDPHVRVALHQRAAALRPDSIAHWGKFTAPAMLAHVIQSLGMMTGDVPVAVERAPWIVRNPPLKHLLIYVLPFPKGLATSPELLARRVADVSTSATASATAWSDEFDALERALDRIGEVARSAKWPAHPAFGPLSGGEWGVLQLRHLNHHFRQFGI